MQKLNEQNINKEMITIQTRENKNGNWWCNSTIQGYDHSFEADTIEDARERMVDFLNDKGISMSDVIWEEPKKYQSTTKKSVSDPYRIGFCRSRIDTDMV